MEGEGAGSVAVYMEYTELPATVERLTTSAPVGLVRVQESNIDLTTGGSFNTPCAATSESPAMIASPTDQHPPSESPTLIPRDQSSFRLVQRHGDDCTTKQHSKPTFGTSIPFKCGNWKKGSEVGMLSGIIIIIWVLFSIPAILYALPPMIREVYLQKLPLPFRLRVFQKVFQLPVAIVLLSICSCSLRQPPQVVWSDQHQIVIRR